MAKPLPLLPLFALQCHLGGSAATGSIASPPPIPHHPRPQPPNDPKAAPVRDTGPAADPWKPLGGLAAALVEDVRRKREALMKAKAQGEDERDA